MEKPLKFSFKTFKHEIIPGCEDFVGVVTYDKAGSYEWDEFALYYSPKNKRYYWYASSGCSCETIWEGVDSVSEFQDGDRKAAIAFVSRWAKVNDDIHRELTQETRARLLNSVRTFVPPVA